jgi:hypothetical protein
MNGTQEWEGAVNQTPLILEQTPRSRAAILGLMEVTRQHRCALLCVRWSSIFSQPTDSALL